jgi:hypothetical protein
MTAIGYISDTEHIIKASWSNIQHDGPAAFKLSERSPLPLAMSAKDHAGGRTEGLNVPRIKAIDCHPSNSDEDSEIDSFSDTQNWHKSKGDLDNPDEGEDDHEADDESDTAPGDGINAFESPNHRVVVVTPNILSLIWPRCRSMK